MKLTAETCDRFVGNGIQIFSPNNPCCYTGEIEAISLSGSQLEIKLRWSVKRDGETWVEEGPLEYSLDLSDGGFEATESEPYCLRYALFGGRGTLYLTIPCRVKKEEEVYRPRYLPPSEMGAPEPTQ